VPVNIAELERRARRLLTPEVYDYYAGGVGRERTLRANVRAWRKYWLLPRVLRDVSMVDTSVRLPGVPETLAATPLAVAPTGFQGLAHPEGEVATARGAARAGALMVLSTRSSMRIEKVAEADVSRAGPATGVTFADIGWLARLGVPVLVKGVLRPDDARACIDAGAAGVIVSNHGGRQLDRALPTALALPGVAAELARAPAGAAPGGVGRVYADGGLRTGEDVLTALGLGAHAVFLGRPVLWALACDGVDGVRDLLTGLTADLAHAMALAGAHTLTGIAGVTGPTTAHSLDT
jgi:4-hydroxymandelate oxidase